MKPTAVKQTGIKNGKGNPCYAERTVASRCAGEAAPMSAREHAISQFKPHFEDDSKFILGLKNVFSNGECQNLIAKSETHVYEAALVNFGGGNVYVIDKAARNSDRVMLDDPSFAAEIFSRVRPWLPTNRSGYTVSGVNERLRFLRYDTSQHFASHYDGTFERPDGSEMSFLTIQIYLNGGEGQFEGGETTFFDDEGNKQCSIRPCPGLVLLFDHDVLHEGSPVKQGRKYAIRSDIMYSRPAGAQNNSAKMLME